MTYTVLKITNTLVFLFFLGSNIYTVAGGGDAATNPWGKHPTYLTPAPYAFWVWALTYFSLAGFVIWQWLPNNEQVNVTVHSVFSHHFALAAIASSLWATLWLENHLILALILLAFTYHELAHLVFNLHRSLVQSSTPPTVLQNAVVHTPVHLWFHTTGFVILLNILAIFTKHYRPEHPGVWNTITSIAAFGVLLAHAVAGTEVGKGFKFGNLVLAWFLFAVAVQQPAQIIRWSAVAVGAVALVYPFKALVRTRTAEETPLLREDV
ncbi:hypothetical protein HK104_008293 [Borealophlyctis nickersoniae]|nr:hypothetical protein HK104_008293 [Borealophlyctis nickersoniae]